FDYRFHNLLHRGCLQNNSATSEIYALTLHDALPIFNCQECSSAAHKLGCRAPTSSWCLPISARSFSRLSASSSNLRTRVQAAARSEEHTSELQSRENLVCRLLLEKKN